MWYKLLSAVRGNQGFWGQLWGKERPWQKRSNTFILLPSVIQSYASTAAGLGFAFRRIDWKAQLKVHPQTPRIMVSSKVLGWSLNHWPAREVPKCPSDLSYCY